MKIEQLEELNKKFEQLEELQRVYERIEKRNSSLYFSGTYSQVIDHILKHIVQKYEKLVIEDLKEEIKKLETELESISIVKLNKLV